jgi:hypothetical protein
MHRWRQAGRPDLSCMEAAANRNAKSNSRYGSTVHKQVYIYGQLKSWAGGAC